MFYKYGITTSTSTLDSLLARISDVPSPTIETHSSMSGLSGSMSARDFGDSLDSPTGSSMTPSGTGSASRAGTVDDSGTSTPLGPPTIEELLDEGDLLVEVKGQNEKLLRFLTTRNSLRSLLSWVTYGLDGIDKRNAQRRTKAVAKVKAMRRARREAIMAQRLKDPESSANDMPTLSTSLASNASAFSTSSGLSGDLDGQEGNLPEFGISSDNQDRQILPDPKGEAQRARYPAIATEILCADQWLVREALARELPHVMATFWDRVLPPLSKNRRSWHEEEDVELEKASATSETDSLAEVDQHHRQWEADVRYVMETMIDEDEENDHRRLEEIRGNWMKVSASLIEKKGQNMLAFLRTSPDVISRMVARIESPSVQDILLRIVAAEEQGVTGTIRGGNLEQQQGSSSPETGGGLNNEREQSNCPSGQRDNGLARDLVTPDSVKRLVTATFSTDVAATLPARSEGQPPEEYHFDPSESQPLPSDASITACTSHALSIVVELVRKNNSDYSEPHLFHTLRNRLMVAQQRRISEREKSDSEAVEETNRDDTAYLESVMEESAQQLGIVHLGPLLEAFSEKIPLLQDRLIRPRSVEIHRAATSSDPLTLERLRIIELYAELLHCSNMTILNRKPEVGPTYSEHGCITGGLDALEALGIALESDPFAEDRVEDGEKKDDKQTDVVSETADSFSKELAIEESETEPTTADSARIQEAVSDPRVQVIAGQPQPSIASSVTLENSVVNHLVTAALKDEDGVRAPFSPVSAGNRLKKAFLDNQVLLTLVNLFFQHPNNNFLHNVVYDVIQQLISGRLSSGPNRDLLIQLFKEANIVNRILDAERIDEKVTATKKGMRLAHMGHVRMLAGELLRFMDRASPDLMEAVSESYVSSEWETFIEGPYAEAHERDNKPLGGGRPLASQGGGFNGVVGLQGDPDTDSSDDDSEDEEISGPLAGQPLSRSASNGVQGFDSEHGAASEESGFRPRDQFSRYLMHETYGQTASSDEDSDDSAGSPHLFPVTGSSGRQRGNSDDAWGEFASAPSKSPAGGADDDSDVDPFADSFEPNPIRHRYLTSADYAEDAFRRQMASEADEDSDSAEDRFGRSPERTGTGRRHDSIESAAHFLASHWSVPAGDVDSYGLGEDLPSVQVATKEERQSSVPDPLSPTSSASDSPNSPTSNRMIPTSSGPAPIPTTRVRRTRGSVSSNSDSGSVSSSPETSRLHPAAKISRRARRNSAMSPPDPSLILATSPDQPFGIGVDADRTFVRPDGKLVRRVNGEEVAVPQDEITRAAHHHRSGSFSSSGSQ